MEQSSWHLPPFQVERVMAASSQSVDWGITALGIPSLWTKTKGKGIRVAVLDTGTSIDHPDLLTAIVEAKDFTGSRYGPVDMNGHSSHCLGIIGARDNDTGVVGVAPECDLLAGKVLGDDGSGSNRSIAAGIRWAIDNRVNIISMSLGSPYPDEIIHRAIVEAVRAGVIVVCAAGNSGPAANTVEYPGKWSEAIAVGAINANRQVATFSSRGPEVAIAAPGEKILSCYLNRSVAVLSGTSMATPYISGIVALMLAKHHEDGGTTPVDTPAQVAEHLRKTAIDSGPVGPDPSFGWGIVNPAWLVGSDLAQPNPKGAVAFTEKDFTKAGLEKFKSLLGEVTQVSARVE